MRTVTKTIYVTNGGKEYDDEASCLKYEGIEDRMAKAQSVYTLIALGSDIVAVFSTKELAELALTYKPKKYHYRLGHSYVDSMFSMNADVDTEYPEYKTLKE